MLVIRFQRVGRTNDPAFRLVVTERRSKPKSGSLEILGSYHPKTKHTILKSERIQYWMSKGAKLSDTAHNLLLKHKQASLKKTPKKLKKLKCRWRHSPPLIFGQFFL
ncbi:MAG: 30S ribosomal protein S16 [Parcubacteria group bacterium GW2011_GWB1_52_7]|nr:MAG: 30S ribosomal protein S16 [Parcubacteria group bacterium GW2011_GWB1_52_7]